MLKFCFTIAISKDFIRYKICNRLCPSCLKQILYKKLQNGCSTRFHFRTTGFYFMINIKNVNFFRAKCTQILLLSRKKKRQKALEQDALDLTSKWESHSGLKIFLLFCLHQNCLNVFYNWTTFVCSGITVLYDFVKFFHVFVNVVKPVRILFLYQMQGVK